MNTFKFNFNNNIRTCKFQKCQVHELYRTIKKINNEDEFFFRCDFRYSIVDIQIRKIISLIGCTFKLNININILLDWIQLFFVRHENVKMFWFPVNVLSVLELAGGSECPYYFYNFFSVLLVIILI